MAKKIENYIAIAYLNNAARNDAEFLQEHLNSGLPINIQYNKFFRAVKLFGRDGNFGNVERALYVGNKNMEGNFPGLIYIGGIKKEVETAIRKLGLKN